MLFGYLIVRTLLGLVRMFGRLPDSYSRVFAACLNSGTRPFHVVNYLGSCGGTLDVAEAERVDDAEPTRVCKCGVQPCPSLQLGNCLNAHCLNDD